jgi:hypothetical protein
MMQAGALLRVFVAPDIRLPVANNQLESKQEHSWRNT